MVDQAKRLRIHASVFTFFISSDELPPQNVEQVLEEERSATTTISRQFLFSFSLFSSFFSFFFDSLILQNYLNALTFAKWPNTIVSAASEATSPITGKNHSCSPLLPFSPSLLLSFSPSLLLSSSILPPPLLPPRSSIDK